jgi:ABC-type polysaccharide transport system permease subunit
MMKASTVNAPVVNVKRGPMNAVKGLWKCIKQHPMMYLMLIPGLFFLFIYKLLPLYGITMAFKDYNILWAPTRWTPSARAPGWV